MQEARRARYPPWLARSLSPGRHDGVVSFALFERLSRVVVAGFMHVRETFAYV